MQPKEGKRLQGVRRFFRDSVIGEIVLNRSPSARKRSCFLPEVCPVIRRESELSCCSFKMSKVVWAHLPLLSPFALESLSSSTSTRVGNCADPAPVFYLDGHRNTPVIPCPVRLRAFNLIHPRTTACHWHHKVNRNVIKNAQNVLTGSFSSVSDISDATSIALAVKVEANAPSIQSRDSGLLRFVVQALTAVQSRRI